MSKVIYTCKKCNWKTNIRSEWSDMKPKRCHGKRCKTNFLIKPEMLDIKDESKSVISNQKN